MSIQRVNRVSRSFYIERPAVVTRNLESLSPHTFKCAHLGIIRIPRLLSQVGRLFPPPFTRPFFASPVLNGVHLRGLNSDSGNTHKNFVVNLSNKIVIDKFVTSSCWCLSCCYQQSSGYKHNPYHQHILTNTLQNIP